MSVKIVNSSAISDLKQRLNKRVEKRRKITKAVMAAIDYPDDPSVIGRPGYVWCRDRAISSADSGGVFQAFNPHVQKRVNLPVVIQNDPREPDRRVITGADWNTLADSSIYAEYPFDVVAHGKTHSFIPGRPTAEYSTDVVDVTERNISSGRVYPNSPAGMTCRVAPVTYVYIDEVKRYSGGTTQDFTANVPGAGLAEMDYICIDGSTNDLAYVRSNTFSWTTWTDPLPPTAYVTIPEGYVLLSSIILYNGLTAIVERNFTYEMRPIFNSVADTGVLSVHDALTLGADMAAIASLNTQELVLDNESANTVFAGPTTGAAADPTFRALVAADIANDLIKDTHIDWGTGANQVSAVDVPIADAGSYFATDNVEAALQQIGPVLAGYMVYDTTAVDLLLTSAHQVVTVTVSGKIITLPTASGIEGKFYYIDNSSGGDITVTANGAETINGVNSQTVSDDSCMCIISNNTNWRII